MPVRNRQRPILLLLRKSFTSDEPACRVAKRINFRDTINYDQNWSSCGTKADRIINLSLTSHLATPIILHPRICLTSEHIQGPHGLRLFVNIYTSVRNTGRSQSHRNPDQTLTNSLTQIERYKREGFHTHRELGRQVRSSSRSGGAYKDRSRKKRPRGYEFAEYRRNDQGKLAGKKGAS